MGKPKKRHNSWHVFMAGWQAHNAYLHGDMSRPNAEAAYELFNKHNKHLTGDFDEEPDSC